MNSQTRPIPIARAFTLIELIVVLAIIAVLAAVLAPALIKQLDYAAAQSEVSLLKRFADGLRASILKTRSIPDQSSWVQVIATSVGLQTNDVWKNTRKVTRVYLIDPALRIGPSSTSQLLPYGQSTNGAAAPVNARLMILSSLAQALPVGNGTNGGFNTIWNTVDGAVPSDSAWSGYTRGDDLKIQRINLAPLFHQLFLNSATNSNCALTFDGSTNNITTNAFSGYYLDGTILALYWTNTLVAQQVLTRDCGFTFETATGWHGSLLNAPTLSGGSGNGAGFTNLDFIIPLFLSCSNNPRSGKSPMAVFTAMTNYLYTYKLWGNAGFPVSGATFDAVNKSSTGSADVLDAATLALTDD